MPCPEEASVTPAWVGAGGWPLSPCSSHTSLPAPGEADDSEEDDNEWDEDGFNDEQMSVYSSDSDSSEYSASESSDSD